MASINSSSAFKETFEPSEEELESSVEKEIVGSLNANITQPSPFFRAAVLALILSLPFWGVLFWFIFT